MGEGRTIKAEEMNENVFSMIGKDWMLVTAGPTANYNTMTASWGGMGVVWNRNVCFVFIRPGRLTYEFMEGSDTFSLCFFSEKWREALDICGTRSGREIDKARETGLSPEEGKYGTTNFSQARLVLTCRKIYSQDIDPDHFLDTAISLNYPAEDYHRMYVGEILEVMLREQP